MSLDWGNEAVWTSAARTALNIDSGFSEKWNGPVRQAFKNFRLDSRNPYDWRLLLTLYVHSHPAEDGLWNGIVKVSATYCGGSAKFGKSV